MRQLIYKMQPFTRNVPKNLLKMAMIAMLSDLKDSEADISRRLAALGSLA